MTSQIKKETFHHNKRYQNRRKTRSVICAAAKATPLVSCKLDAKWKQVKEERDSIMLENEELQEQLDMANSAQSAGNIRMNEFRNDLNKVTEENIVKY